MELVLNTREVIDSLLKVEEGVKRFYASLIKSVKKEDEKHLFESLERMKDKNIKDISKFQDIIDINIQSVIEDEAKFISMMMLYMNSWVFESLNTKIEEMKKQNIKGVINFSINLEKELLLFYHGLKEHLITSVAVLEDVFNLQKNIILLLQGFSDETEEDLNKLLLVALESELMAKQFYERAKKKASSKTAKDFFQNLADFEQGHFNRIKRIIDMRIKSLGLDSIEPEGTEIIKKSEVEGEIEPNKDEIADVLMLAIDAEKDANKRYLEIANRIGDPAGKKIFDSLAEAERTHQRILEDEFFSLSNNGKFL